MTTRQWVDYLGVVIFCGWMFTAFIDGCEGMIVNR